MKARTMSKGLVVLAITSQMAFGGVQEAKQTIVNTAKVVATATVSKAKQGYEAAKPYAQKGCAAVAQTAKNGFNHVCAAAKPVKEGFVNGVMVLFDRSGVAKLWVNHHDACVSGLTVAGMAAVYAAYKYRKACQAQKQLEELKAQGYKIA